MSTPLQTTTDEQAPVGRRAQPVSWYRTPLSPETIKYLHERSDWWGSLQTLGYLGVLIATGSLTLYSSRHWPWWVTAALVFLHGTCFAFQINAVHELGHGTVFRTKWLNAFFERVFAFFGWINFEMFDVSHVRHHQYTLHPPDDLEVVLPIRIVVKNFFRSGFVNYQSAINTPKDTVRIARGQMVSPWELTLFPDAEPVKRRAARRWAWTLLIGHGLIVLISLACRWWWLPVLVTLAPFYGGWLFFLCNNTQHIGLQDNVSDFRLCCRTFTLNPVAQFLYWHMNYHIEHHMYAAVPCYKLGQLHAAIQNDLPPCPRGIAATWQEIAAIQKIQASNPQYQHLAALPQKTLV